MSIGVSLLASAGNYHLVQVEGRAYPALAIQGDSLKVLQEVVAELTECISTGDVEGVTFALGEVSETVGAMITGFEEMSHRVGKDLPYVP